MAPFIKTWWILEFFKQCDTKTGRAEIKGYYGLVAEV